ncbi:MAG: hypothetical protein ACJ790_08525 [Myxococcaceae bacterium]
MPPVSSTPDRLAVFLHSGDYDRVHQGLSIAAAAAASGRPVQIYFFWWALERLVQDRLDEPDLREDVADRFERRQTPTLRQLLEHVRSSGTCQVMACTGSLGLVADPDAVAKKVDRLVGWSTILKETAGVIDRFYL